MNKILQALEDAEAFIDRHSEPWYRPGQELLTEVREAIALMRGQSYTCAWQKDDDEWEGAHWDSACGEKYFFVEGGPSDNGHKFCHGCGKPLHIIEPKDTADEQ